jgi:hypothetical protein
MLFVQEKEQQVSMHDRLKKLLRYEEIKMKIESKRERSERR